MQFIFIIGAFMFTMTLILSSLPRTPEPVFKQSEGLLLNMATWHTAASKYCLANTCVTGTVNPSSKLPDVVAANLPSLQSTFETRYNASTRDLVTYFRSGALAKFEGPTVGTVTGSLGDVLGTAQTSSVGIYDSASGKVVPNYRIRLGYEKAIPAAIGNRITNGSPIIATKM
jgi:hypothetical protein